MSSTSLIAKFLPKESKLESKTELPDELDEKDLKRKILTELRADAIHEQEKQLKDIQKLESIRDNKYVWLNFVANGSIY